MKCISLNENPNQTHHKTNYRKLRQPASQPNKKPQQNKTKQTPKLPLRREIAVFNEASLPK